MDKTIHEDLLRNFLGNVLTGTFGMTLGDNAQFDLETVNTGGNTLLEEHTLDRLVEQVEIVVDFHQRPDDGDEDETAGRYYSEANAGTTAFHAYVMPIVTWGTKIQNELSEGWIVATETGIPDPARLTEAIAAARS